VAVIVFLTLGLAGAAGGAPAADSTDGDDRARLAAGCDDLLGSAVKTPYGWGWKSSEVVVRPVDPRATPPRPAAPRRGSATAQAATIDVRSTAAAGLVLHLAGRQLGEARYTHAALQAARAIAAVQMNTGQVPATGVVRANAGGRDEPAAVPSRAATCAGLGLLLTLVHDHRGDDADADGEQGTLAREGGPIHRAAVKAAKWLAGQQTRSGGWLVGYPPDAAPGDATRLVRLDTPEYRDATIALWLAADVLGDDRLARKAEQAVEDLVVLRIADERGAGNNLWSSAYGGDGALMRKFPELAPAIDTLASRNAMQALLAACLLGDAEATAPVLKEAAAALAKLPRVNGAWRRIYDLNVSLSAPAPPPPGGDAPAPAADEPPTSPLFPSASPGPGESELAIGVAEMVRAASRLEAVGHEGLLKELDAGLPFRHRLALVACGLADEAIAAEAATPGGGAANAGDLPARLRELALLAWRMRSSISPAQSNGDETAREKTTGG
jgi:hypothetical protein